MTIGFLELDRFPKIYFSLLVTTCGSRNCHIGHPVDALWESIKTDLEFAGIK
jgi:hypothetical protein